MERKIQKSEIEQLLNQIEEEYVAAQRGLTSFAEGAKHSVISARMHNMGKIHENLRSIVGDEAIKLIAERLESIDE